MAKRPPKDARRGKKQGLGAFRLSLDDSRARERRQDLVPGSSTSYANKLKAARSVDLKDNAKFELLPGGYVRVIPKDPAKRHG